MKTLVFCAIALPGLAVAQDTESFPPPPLEYYVGTYQMIGKDAAGALVDTSFRMDISGKNLGITMCGVPDAGHLDLPETFGGDHYIEGRIASFEVVCDPFNSYENYPLLACYTDDGARLTLWPGPVFGNPLNCNP